MNVKDINDLLQLLPKESLRLYFVSRKKKNLKKSDWKQTLDRYDYSLYRVEIKDDLRNFLFDLSVGQFKSAYEEKYQLVDYDLFLDDADKKVLEFKYDQALPFMKIVGEKLSHKDDITSVDDFSSILSSGEEFWAYIVELSYVDDNGECHYLYFMRKILGGRTIVDETDNVNKKFFSKIKTYFNTTTKKMEILHGDMFILDKQIDCVYIDDTYYILHKTQFESMVGLEVEYKERAEKITEELASSDSFEGIDVLRNEVNTNANLHKKLLKLSQLSGTKKLSTTRINNIKKLASKVGYDLKMTEENKIKLEDSKDVEMVVRFLCEYYKKGMVNGKMFGTYSGRTVPIKGNSH